MKRLLILFVFAGSLFAAEYHPSLPAIGSLDGLGVNIHFTEPQPGELEMIKAAGFKWVRMDLTWGATERDRGTYDFSAYDRLVAALEKHGLRAVFILDYGNKLYDEGLAPHTDDGRAAFAKWAAAAVARYAGKGLLWELWNEPNIAQFWKPKPDVQQYIALAKTVCPAIRAVAPKEALIGPATSKIDLVFLEECFKAGLLEHWCAVSVHPYRQTAPETVEEEYRTVRLLIRKYAPKDKTIPVLSGEWGYSTAWKEYDEEKQAKYLARMFLTNIANDVPLSIWYDWRDDGDDPKEAEHRFGVVRRNYQPDRVPVFEPKPAYQGARIVSGHLAGFKFNKMLSTRVRSGFGEGVAYLFGRLPQLAVVLWGEHPTYWRYRMSPIPPALNLGKSSVRIAERGLDAAAILEKEQIVAETGVIRASFSGEPIYGVLEKPNRWLKIAAGCGRIPLEYFSLSEAEEMYRSKLQVENLTDVPLTILPPEYMRNRQTETVVQPGKSAEVELRFNASPLRNSPPSASEVKIDFKTGRWPLGALTQRVVVARGDPVRCDLELTRMGTLMSTLTNESEHPAEGELRLWLWPVEDAPPIERKEADCREIVAPLARNTVVKVTFPAELPRNQWCQASVALYRGKTQELSTSRFFYRNSFFTASEREADQLKIVADGDPGIAVTHDLQFRDPDGDHSGAARLVYRFSSGWRFLRMITSAREFPPLQRPYSRGADGKPIVECPTEFGVWIHGDAKSCQTRLRFKDATGQTFQSDGPRIDFSGWRFVKFPMRSTTVPLARPFMKFPIQPTGDGSLHHWGGANDGMIHYPIKWDTIFLLDNVSREPVEGEIFLSAPTLIY